MQVRGNQRGRLKHDIGLKQGLKVASVAVSFACSMEIKFSRKTEGERERERDVLSGQSTAGWCSTTFSQFQPTYSGNESVRGGEGREVIIQQFLSLGETEV